MLDPLNIYPETTTPSTRRQASQVTMGGTAEQSFWKRLTAFMGSFFSRWSFRRNSNVATTSATQMPTYSIPLPSGVSMAGNPTKNWVFDLMQKMLVAFRATSENGASESQVTALTSRMDRLERDYADQIEQSNKLKEANAQLGEQLKKALEALASVKKTADDAATKEALKEVSEKADAAATKDEVTQLQTAIREVTTIANAAVTTEALNEVKKTANAAAKQTDLDQVKKDLAVVEGIAKAAVTPEQLGKLEGKVTNAETLAIAAATSKALEDALKSVNQKLEGAAAAARETENRVESFGRQLRDSTEKMSSLSNSGALLEGLAAPFYFFSFDPTPARRLEAIKEDQSASREEVAALEIFLEERGRILKGAPNVKKLTMQDHLRLLKKATTNIVPEFTESEDAAVSLCQSYLSSERWEETIVRLALAFGFAHAREGHQELGDSDNRKKFPPLDEIRRGSGGNLSDQAISAVTRFFLAEGQGATYLPESTSLAREALHTVQRREL